MGSNKLNLHRRPTVCGWNQLRLPQSSLKKVKKKEKKKKTSEMMNEWINERMTSIVYRVLYDQTVTNKTIEWEVPGHRCPRRRRTSERCAPARRAPPRVAYLCTTRARAFIASSPASCARRGKKERKKEKKRKKKKKKYRLFTSAARTRVSARPKARLIRIACFFYW